MNFFKFASIVLNEFPEALRQIFVDMWNKRIAPHHSNQVWDDSVGVHNLLLNIEGSKTKIPKNSSFQDWDCTTLFQATLYAKTFALPDSKGNMKTLGEFYLRNLKLLPGQFHSHVTSPSGDPNETIALAIDQLRLLRNTLCHPPSPCVVKGIFDDYVKYAKEAFTAVSLSTKSLETIGNLTESNFPTMQVEKLNERIQKARDDFHQFLHFEVIGGLEDVKETTEETKTKMEETKTKMEEAKTKMEETKMKMDETNKNVGEIKIKLDEVLEKQKTEGKLPCFELFQFSKPTVFLSTALARVDTML